MQAALAGWRRAPKGRITVARRIRRPTLRLAAITVFSVFVATAGMAQLKPGAVVRAGNDFPFVADFNGDGLDDLVQERNVILNDRGSFGEPRDLALPSSERVIGVLDVNGDHILELLTLDTSAQAPPGVNQPSDHSRIYRMYMGNVARHYANPTIIATTGATPYIADVDGDAKDDFVLVTPLRPDGIRETAAEGTVLRSRGDGTFETLAPFRMPPNPQLFEGERIPAGDVDHDGLQDLVIRAASDIVVLHGVGGGRFAVERRYYPMNPSLGGWSTQLADIDGDSHLDILMVAKRSIRVLFGDGRGRFLRMTRADVAKVHDIAGLGAGLAELLHVDELNQPRNLAIGHFTRSDRQQVAVGTVEGDLVVFSYEQGALREVSRTATEFWGLNVYSGAFLKDGGTGVYVLGTLIWGAQRPRVFESAASGAGPAAEQPSGRRRASAPAAAATILRVELSGACMNSTTDRWGFARDGVFGFAHQDETTVEAVFDGTDIYYRLSASYLPHAAEGVLTESNGTYSGTVMMQTSCGLNPMTVTARRD
jgi:hypothetical protein